MTDTAPAPKFCSECGAPLSPTAKFCHACGHPTDPTAVPAVRLPAVRLPDVPPGDDDQDLPDSPLITASQGLAAKLPWILGLVGVIGGATYLSVAGPKSTPAAAEAGAAPFAPFANGNSGAAPPDIANMSPNERANRLYGRIMAYVQAGKADSAAFFAPMALAAHEMLENKSIDERYHLGQINEMLGNAAVAAAHADTILKAEPENLLGLMLATHAARLANKAADIKTYDALFLKVLDAQLATKKPEYDMHKAEIERTAAEARGGK